MSITFVELQERFRQVWLVGGLLPASVTIAEADYESLQHEMIGERRASEKEEDRYKPRAITYIINSVNDSMVEVLCDPEQPSGSIILNEAE